VPAYFPENNNPLPLDTEVRSLQKINDLLKGGVGLSLTNSGLYSDAFGRLRTSNPFTLFDSSHRYQDNGLWSTSTATGGTTAFNANQGLVDLTVTSSSGSQVLRETTKVFAYQPGKSLLSMSTFVMAPAKTNLRQRVGYFGADNGIFLQLNDNTLSFIERSLSTGTTTQVDQANWNTDRLDGSGPSGFTLDITKSQILWLDMEWLGVGTVRMGFVINGEFVTCHSFHHANLISPTYITTACLPLRYEITNTGVTSGSSTLKQVCSTVISEGGYQLNGAQQSALTPILSPYTLVTAGTVYPIVSVRLKSTRLDAIAILTAVSFMPTEANDYNWQIRAACTTAGGSWGNSDANSSVEYNVTGTGVSGGRILNSGFVKSTSSVGPSIDISGEALFRFQLERNSFTSTPFEIALVAATSGSGTVNKNVFASLDWDEISR
jgi:hypothetical protein